MDTLQGSPNVLNRSGIRQKILKTEAMLAKLGEYRAMIDTMSSEDIIVSGLYGVSLGSHSFIGNWGYCQRDRLIGTPREYKPTAAYTEASYSGTGNQHSCTTMIYTMTYLLGWY